MQTATVWASGRHDSVLVRILLDSSSQRTFIRHDWFTRLSLPSVSTESLSLLAFGSSKRFRNYRYHTVQLKLQSHFDPHEITMDALEVPEVCTMNTPAIGQDLLMQLHERKMLVADEPRLGDRVTQIISVIIGSDNYWHTVTGRIERLSKYLCAVATIFGWLVQGIYQVDTANGLHLENSSSSLFLSCERHSQATSCMADPTETWRLGARDITGPPKATIALMRKPLWCTGPSLSLNHSQRPSKNSSIFSTDVIYRLTREVTSICPTTVVMPSAHPCEPLRPTWIKRLYHNALSKELPLTGPLKGSELNKAEML
ncbi:hypothetical protein HPB51_029420 [Rhipicephalus microplus]|uniref:Peptidase aspartic putative domain-containing protein n=1 Tax=Rhipicephalus microplus TaxID=6941 RepID=A0A9J6CUQ4_RHIMP|nr:hypothetical protein HPB51_029420 [Rhipicephalus microplus]